MICGVGTDIVEIERIRGSLSKFGETFIKKVFTDKEAEYCKDSSDPAIRFAARFAAKEAVIKAVSGFISGHLDLREIEVFREADGRPSINITKYGVITSDIRFHVSISHESNYAVATVIAEKQ
jgi:holo-[acyl-carrier protein] synthase